MRLTRFSLLLLAGLLAVSAHAQPVPKTASAPVALRSQIPSPPRLGARAFEWDDRFGKPGVTLYANAVAVAPNGDVYVGGYLYDASGLRANGVARWDGRRWHALGDGVDGTVHAIAVTPAGDVYVGGDFQNAGAARANGIARWSPATETWSPLGDTMDGTSRGTVYALTAAPDGSVYAGGDFTQVGGIAVGNVARYADGTWASLGTGVGAVYGSEFNVGGGTVYALALDGTALYVGGRFDATATVASVGVVRWNTEAGTWSGLGGVGDTYGAGTVRALAASGGALYAAGTFTTAGGVTARNVARWDGAAWSALGMGLEGIYGTAVHGLALADGQLYATGVFDAAGGFAARGMARWDGAAWSGVAGGLDAVGKALAVGADGLYVVGEFDTVGAGVRADGVARWTGAEWRALGLGIGYASIEGTVHAMAWMGDVLVVGGGFDYAGGRPIAGVAAWDGTDWQPLGEGVDGDVYALTVGADGALYVGGAFTTAGGQTASHVARWDGTAWTPLENGVNGVVRSLAAGPDGEIFVGGSFSAAGAANARNVAVWSGGVWSGLGQGVDGTVYALAPIGGGAVYVGGDIGQAGGVDAAGIAGWNGTAWVPLGDGVMNVGSVIDYPGTVYALAIADGQLYIGGAFAKAGTSAAAGLARFDGTTWSALGTGLGGGDQEAYALYADGADVYVGGNFETAGGLRVNNLARWTAGADTWASVGGGIVFDDEFGEIRAVEAYRGALFVGGRYFNQAGGQPVAAIARWGDDEAGQGTGKIAVDPLTHDFEETAVGEAQALLVTVRNDGDGPLTGTVGAPTGAGAGAFAVVEGGGPFTLAPGGSRSVIVEFRPQTAGHTEAALPITHDGGATGSPITVVLQGTGVAIAEAVVVRAFDPTGPQLLWTAGQSTAAGFVFGPNQYGDRAKGVALTVPEVANGRRAAASVSEVRVWYAYKGPFVGERTYTLALYDGDAETGPVGEPLFSGTYRIADIVADEDGSTRSEPTVYALPQAVPVSGSFFVVVDFGTYDSVDLAAVAAGDRTGSRVPEVWEQLTDGTWVNVSDSWTGDGADGSGENGWHLWMEATVTTGGATDNEGVASLATVLEPPHPNPFHATTTLTYSLAEAGPVSLRVFDLLGREVDRLDVGVRLAGRHEVRMDGAALPSGVYIVRLETRGSAHVQRLVLTR